ncbi:YozE family protein [Dellaglioa sp. P0083]|uniref:YozE family protein n=1 Tax=Dellaglioa kimchii TaxID=3344667 RepID=UPI0038D4D5FF
MRQTFYQFLMTERNDHGTDEVSQFANNAFYDQSFPKLSDKYDFLSNYLELNAGYLPSMTIFDDAWARYLDKMN